MTSDGPNGPFSDLIFTLPDPGIPRVCPSIRPYLYQVLDIPTLQIGVETAAAGREGTTVILLKKFELKTAQSQAEIWR